MVRIITPSKNASPGVWKTAYNLIKKFVVTPCKILDVACGTHKWELRNATLVRADIKKFDTDVLVLDANTPLPFGDNEFDFVVSVETIEHLENPLQFLREIKRVTRIGAIITTPNGLESTWYSPEHYDVDGHITILSDWLIEKHFQKVGMDVIAKKYNNKRKEILIYYVTFQIPDTPSMESDDPLP